MAGLARAGRVGVQLPLCACKVGGLSVGDRTWRVWWGGGRPGHAPRAEAGLLVHVVVVVCVKVPVRRMGKREGGRGTGAPEGGGCQSCLGSGAFK